MRFFASITTLFISVFVHAGNFTDFPGSIPLKFERQAASDLVYKGKVLLPDEARALYESKVISDLSLLDPAESVVWKKSAMPSPTDDEMGVNFQSDEFSYVSDTEVPVGRHGIVVSKTDAKGAVHTYQIVLDVKNHNVLLRKALLRKLGYVIPPTARLQKAKIHFKGAFSKKEFIKGIERNTFLEPSRWVTDGADTDDGDLTIQDAIIFAGANDPFYNLSRGDISASEIQGRRAFNALLVPFNMVDVTESVNLFPWDSGRVFNGQLVLNYDDAEEFSTPYEDARWIARSILKLTRLDWEQIVAAGEFPPEVSALLLEKLVARRNFLSEHLGFNGGVSDLPVNSKISMGTRLVNGKLTGEFWSGYASHFAGKDPDSPLSGDEVFGFFKSKFLTNLISNLLVQFNDRYVPHTDIGAKLFDHQLDLAAWQLSQFILTGKVKEVPFGVWATPTYGGNVIASREVVAGNYLGAENIVQLADTIGFAVDAGAFVKVDGLPTKLTVSGSAKAFLVRTYTHLKPVFSIRAALKEPFRNMIVPWLKSKQADPLAEIMKLESLRSQIGEEEYAKRLKTQLEEFKKRLGVGESLIIQTSIGTDLTLQPGYGITQDLEAYARFKDKLTKVARLQIFRKDENTIQIYRDPAMYNLFDISLGLQARIQVLEVGWAWLSGAAHTEYFQVNLESDTEKNPDFFKNVSAIRRVLRRSRTDELKGIQAPWKIDHSFRERDFHLDFLIWRYMSSSLMDLLRITSPSGVSKDFVRKVIGKRTGRDYESVTIDILDSLVDEYLDVNPKVNLSSTNSGNPGDTFKGNAFSRQVTLESEVTSTGPKTRTLDFSSLYLGIDYRWKGWEMSQKKAQRILDEVSAKFGTQLFPRYTLNETKSIQFYSIDITVSFYQDAIEAMLAQSDSAITAIYDQYSVLSPSQKDFRAAHVRQFIGYMRKIQKSQAVGDAKDVAEKIAKLVNLMESTLRFEGMLRIVGGINNLFVRGDLRGFKAGDERGQHDVYSHTLGQVGSMKPNGPLRYIQSNLGISDGEMLIYWLLNRL